MYETIADSMQEKDLATAVQLSRIPAWLDAGVRAAGVAAYLHQGLGVVVCSLANSRVDH